MIKWPVKIANKEFQSSELEWALKQTNLGEKIVKIFFRLEGKGHGKLLAARTQWSPAKPSRHH